MKTPILPPPPPNIIVLPVVVTLVYIINCGSAYHSIHIFTGQGVQI